MNGQLINRLVGNQGVRLLSCRDVHKLLWPRFVGVDREHLWRVDLNSRDGLIGGELVSIGTIDGTSAHPREVFAGALEARASRIILAHNHPSSDVSPSEEDVAMTARLATAGLVLGVELVEHLIIFNEKYFSFKESGLLSRRKLWRRKPSMKY
jgi:DNA repair protein RadC